jgi:hypothetical protein
MAHDTAPHSVGPEKRAMIQETAKDATTGRSERATLHAKLWRTGEC